MAGIWFRGMLIGVLSSFGLTSAAAVPPISRIDDDGMLVVANRRTFVFGCYHNPETAEGLQRLREAGFNVVSSKSTREALDLVEKQKMLAWVPLGGLLSPANPAEEAKLVSTVRSLADHRSLVAWEIADEALWNVWYGRHCRLEEEWLRLNQFVRDREKAGVNCAEIRKLMQEQHKATRRADFASAEELDRQIRKLAGAPPQKPDLQLSRAPAAAEQLRQQLLRGYQLVHQADCRPVWMNYAPRNTPDDLRRFAAAADIVGCDIYPVPITPATRHSDLVNRELSSVGEYTDRFRQAGDGRPVWMVLQGFGWRDLHSQPSTASTAPADVGRRPTHRETRLMLYDALVHGARGIMYWGTKYAAEPPAFLEDLEAVVREASAQSTLWSARDAAAQPKVSYGPTMVSVDRPPRVLAKQDGSRLGLLVVNEHNGGLEVHVAGLAVVDGTRIAILGETDGCVLAADRVAKGEIVLFMPAESAVVLATGQK